MKLEILDLAAEDLISAFHFYEGVLFDAWQRSEKMEIRPLTVPKLIVVIDHSGSLLSTCLGHLSKMNNNNKKIHTTHRICNHTPHRYWSLEWAGQTSLIFN